MIGDFRSPVHSRRGQIAHGLERSALTSLRRASQAVRHLPSGAMTLPRRSRRGPLRQVAVQRLVGRVRGRPRLFRIPVLVRGGVRPREQDQPPAQRLPPRRRVRAAGGPPGAANGPAGILVGVGCGSWLCGRRRGLNALEAEQGIRLVGGPARVARRASGPWGDRRLRATSRSEGCSLLFT